MLLTSVSPMNQIHTYSVSRSINAHDSVGRPHRLSRRLWVHPAVDTYTWLWPSRLRVELNTFLQICVQNSLLTPQYVLSLNICGGSGFPVTGLESSGTFSLIHFRLASLAAMSHSSYSILLAARKPITSCCCFLICEEGRYMLIWAVWGNKGLSSQTHINNYMIHEH